jgi:glycine/D-amino acid oxidase-like deaminating enzyme
MKQNVNNRTDSSFWLKNCPATNFPKLEKGLKVDVAVLGGGIAGITTAKLLKDSGNTVAVIESDRIVKDVTVGTTAKITMGTYNILLSNLGKIKAQAIANANIKAFHKMIEIVKNNNINCELHRLPLYIYTESQEKANETLEEFEAAEQLGLPVSYIEEVPLPFKTGPAIKYDNQAQFHPRKYLLGLSMEIPGDGSYVFEKTRANNIIIGENKEVITDQGSIMANKVVVATHNPVFDPDELKNHLTPARSYVIGLYANEEFPDGMFVDIETAHTYRTTPTEEGNLILVAGEHSPVNVDDKNVYYGRLENYARQHLTVESIKYHWSNYDCITDDGLPMIGMTSVEGVYVATGFGFWGMTTGTLSAMVISDLIMGKENQFAELFDPLRFQ